MEAFLISILAVAVSEIGDKTQLVALMLAARFQRPVPIILGILVATLANHTLAALAGEWVRTRVPAEYLRWGLGLSFLVVAVWALLPDRLEFKAKDLGRYGVFMTAAVAFFLAEMGDKTQVATAMLAAKYGALIPVVGGTTLGMMIADVPAVLLGGAAAKKIPLKAVRYAAAAIFALLGVSALAGRFG
jgi:putative Ca2+/H+ antiporter (TMEM165/GDT1 family)